MKSLFVFRGKSFSWGGLPAPRDIYSYLVGGVSEPSGHIRPTCDPGSPGPLGEEAPDEGPHVRDVRYLWTPGINLKFFQWEHLRQSAT